jgi:hypothetical protein
MKGQGTPFLYKDISMYNYRLSVYAHMYTHIQMQ